jgi:hypothetical protein
MKNPQLPSGNQTSGRGGSINQRAWLTLIVVLAVIVLTVLLTNHMLATALQQVFRVLLTVIKYNIRLILAAGIIFWLYKKFVQKR